MSARLFSMKTDAACVNLSNLVTSNVTKPEILNNCICVFHLCFLFVLYLRLPFFHICIFDFVIALYRFAFASFICVLTHGLHLHLCLCCQRTRQKCRDQCMNVVYFDVCESLKPCHKQPEILNIYICALE